MLQAKIEQTALGASREECQALGFDTPNVAACFGPDGSKYYKRWAVHGAVQ